MGLREWGRDDLLVGRKGQREKMRRKGSREGEVEKRVGSSEKEWMG